MSTIRDAIEDLARGVDKDFVDFAKIAASELCENAIKYGVGKRDSDMKFQFSIDDHMMSIIVTNGVSDPVHAENLKGYIDLIKQNDPFVLYTNRLHDLLENKNPEVSHLGLFRIAYVCQFDMNYEIQGNVVKVTASKKLKG